MIGAIVLLMAASIGIPACLIWLEGHHEGADDRPARHASFDARISADLGPEAAARIAALRTPPDVAQRRLGCLWFLLMLAGFLLASPVLIFIGDPLMVVWCALGLAAFGGGIAALYRAGYRTGHARPWKDPYAR